MLLHTTQEQAWNISRGVQKTSAAQTEREREEDTSTDEKNNAKWWNWNEKRRKRRQNDIHEMAFIRCIIAQKYVLSFAVFFFSGS